MTGKQHKRVFIIGSGASKAHSKGVFPLAMEFFKTSPGINISPSENLREYVWQNFHLDVDKDEVDIEDVFTYLEIHLQNSNDVKLLHVRQQLLQFIRDQLWVLEQKSQPLVGQNYGKLSGEGGMDDTFITFNWDLLFDNALHRQQMLRDHDRIEKIKNQYSQFMQQLAAPSEGTYSGLFREPYKQGERLKVGYYLKLHGSIDWRFCTNRGCRSVDKVFPVSDPDKEYFCGDCHERMEVLVIPPILNKDYGRYPFIRRLWNVASHEIHQADELVIWGYSLPPTDFYSKWLLRQARSTFLKKLVLVNPAVVEAGRETENKQFTSVFRNIFLGEVSSEDVCLYKTLEDYYQDKRVFAK